MIETLRTRLASRLPYAITLRLDCASAAVVTAIARPFLEVGWSPPVAIYPPHVTLCAYPNDAPLHQLRATIERLAARWQKLPIALASLGIFIGPPPVLFLAPVVTAALLARYAELSAALPRMSADPHFQPTAWVPHVTLAIASQDVRPALTDLPALPIPAALDRLELVRFPPTVILASLNLGSTEPPSRETVE